MTKKGQPILQPGELGANDISSGDGSVSAVSTTGASDVSEVTSLDISLREDIYASLSAPFELVDPGGELRRWETARRHRVKTVRKERSRRSWEMVTFGGVDDPTSHRQTRCAVT